MVKSSEFFTISTYMKYATIPATLIVVVLVLLQRRVKPHPCGYFYPALVVPMRFLDGYKDRWSYALCFGAIASIIINVFFDSLTTAGGGTTDNLFCGHFNSSSTTARICHEVWVKTLVLQGQALVGSLVCVPYFICISTPFKLIGAVFGFLYSVYWVVFYVVEAVNLERNNDVTIGTLGLLIDLPVIACSLGLCIRSVWAVYHCYRTKTMTVQVVDNVVEKHQVDHVVSLFRPPVQLPEPEGVVERVKRKVASYWLPDFRLPTRVISIAFAQLLLVYFIAIVLTMVGILLKRLLTSLLTYEQLNVSDSSVQNIFHLYDAAYVISTVIVLASSVIYVTLFVINYRLNMVKIYRGRKHQEFPEAADISTATCVAQSLRLPGYQFAYIIWGTVILFIVMLVILMAVFFGIYYLVYRDIFWSTVSSAAQTLSAPLLAMAIFYLQVFVVRFYLLQPKLNDDDKYHPLNVDNRRLYEVLAYTLMFTNLIVGAVSALLRTARSFIMGLIFLGRLDRCLLMKGFESMDKGYMAYVGTLFVDNAHNNPTMRCFCALLTSLTCTPGDTAHLGLSHLPPRNLLGGSNSRAARRWHLAYTLLHNPNLLPRRKLALLLTRRLDAFDDNSDNPTTIPTTTRASLGKVNQLRAVSNRGDARDGQEVVVSTKAGRGQSKRSAKSQSMDNFDSYGSTARLV